MKNIFPFSLILVFSFLDASAQETKDSGALEPKNRFELTINGKIYQAMEGQPLTLDATPSGSTVVIKLSDRKKFDAASVSFDYPRHLSFEYDKDTDLRTWRLNGNNLIVTLFELDAQVPLSALVESMVNKFGKENCTVEDFKKQFGNQLTSGKRLHVKLVGTNMIIDFYTLDSSESRTRIITFQDSLQDNGDSSDEFNAGFQMISSTIKFS